MILNGIRVYNCYNLDGNNVIVNVIREVSFIKMFIFFLEKSFELFVFLLYRRLVYLDFWLKGFLFIVIEIERSFKIVVGYKVK